jgi:ATP-dependent Clp protease ATP-binding subunit ClpA
VGTVTVKAREFVFDSHAKRVVELAFEEARMLSNNYVGTGHLTLALMCEEKSVAARVIATIGRVNHRTPLVAIRIDFLARDPSEKSEPKPDPPGSRCPHCSKRVTVLQAE